MDEPYNPDEPKEDDSEARSVFVSQLAARLTARDLGYFFEDKLGDNTVMDSRIVTDRLSRRSKGSVLLQFSFLDLLFIFFVRIGYVEFRSIDLVEKALALSGTVVMGLPIMVQLTESERNKLHPGDGCVYIFLAVPVIELTSTQESESSSGCDVFSWIHAVRLQCLKYPPLLIDILPRQTICWIFAFQPDRIRY